MNAWRQVTQNHSLDSRDLNNGTYHVKVSVAFPCSVKLVVNMDKNLPGAAGELPPVTLTFGSKDSRLAPSAALDCGDADAIEQSPAGENPAVPGQNGEVAAARPDIHGRTSEDGADLDTIAANEVEIAEIVDPEQDAKDAITIMLEAIKQAESAAASKQAKRASRRRRTLPDTAVPSRMEARRAAKKPVQ